MKTQKQEKTFWENVLSHGVTDAHDLEMRHKAIAERLRDFAEGMAHQEDAQQKKLNRTIWRAGELRIAEAVPHLKKLARLKASPSLRTYSICWALGQIRQRDGLETIETLQAVAEKNLLKNFYLNKSLRQYAYETEQNLQDRKTQFVNWKKNYQNAWYDEEITKIDNVLKLGPQNLQNHVWALSVLSICLEARYWLSAETERGAYLESLLKTLPENLQHVFKHGDAHSISDHILHELTEIAKTATITDPKFQQKAISESIIFILEKAYLLSLRNPEIRKSLFLVLEKLPLTEGYLKAFYTLWKLAEFRTDTELFAHVIRVLETNKSKLPRHSSWDETFKVHLRTLSPNSIQYLRRRSWRILRRMGEIGDKTYLEMASAILLSLSDDDATEIKTETISKYIWNAETRKYDWRQWTRTNDAYAPYLCFGRILYDNSQAHKLSSSNLWLIDNAAPETRRSEAFPDLWDQTPDKLLHLLKQSACAPVHKFAATALKDNKEYIAKIPLNDWMVLLKSRYEQTAILALENVKAHYLYQDPDTNLIRLCLTSPFAPLKEAGKEWLARMPYVLRQNIDLLAWMVTSSDDDICKLSREYISVLDGQDDKQQELLGHLINFALDCKEDVSGTAIENISWVLRNPLKTQLRHITFDVIGLLVSHKAPAVNLLGAQILSARNLKPHDIPPALYGKLFNSPAEAVRAEAIALMGNLKDEELAAWHEMIGNLLISDQPAVRREARKLLARAQTADKTVGDKILQKLLAVLFKTEAAEGIHDDVLNVLSKELQATWPGIDKNQLWRLLNAQSKGAQTAGSNILQPRPFETFSVRQWARLGGNPSLNVRSWAWRAFEDNLERVKTNLDDALHLFDSTWPDSRSFAFSYFEKHFPHSEWTPEQIIGLCDSKHQDVQTLGRQVVSEKMKLGQGQAYLNALSEHPSLPVQKLVGAFLDTYTEGQFEKITPLKPYFLLVLGRVNKGRSAKSSILDFLHKYALEERKTAEFTVQILNELSLTSALIDKTKTLEILRDIAGRYPGLTLVAKIKKPEMRGLRSEINLGAGR